jgi:hypothetical protein
MGVMRNSYRIFIGKPEWKIPLGRIILKLAMPVEI